MNFKELKNRIDTLYKSAHNPELITVYITTSEQSIGGRAKADVDYITLGFDWENNQLRINPKQKLIKWNKENV